MDFGVSRSGGDERKFRGHLTSVMTFGCSKGFRISRRGLASRFDLNDLGFTKRVGTVEVDIGKTLFIDREGRTLSRFVVIDTALARSVVDPYKEWTLEQDLTAVPTVVALPVSFLQLLFDVVFAQPSVKESADLT
jgi:hypothetical protein